MASQDLLRLLGGSGAQIGPADPEPRYPGLRGAELKPLYGRPDPNARWSPDEPIPGGNPEAPDATSAILGLLMSQGLMSPNMRPTESEKAERAARAEQNAAPENPSRREFFKKGGAAAAGVGMLGPSAAKPIPPAAPLPPHQLPGQDFIDFMMMRFSDKGLYGANAAIRRAKELEALTKELAKQAEGKPATQKDQWGKDTGNTGDLGQAPDKPMPEGKWETRVGKDVYEKRRARWKDAREHNEALEETNAQRGDLFRYVDSLKNVGDPLFRSYDIPVNYGEAAQTRGSRKPVAKALVPYKPKPDDTGGLGNLSADQMEMLVSMLEGKYKAPTDPEKATVDLVKDPRNPKNYTSVSDIAKRMEPFQELYPEFNRLYEAHYDKALNDLLKGRKLESLPQDEQDSLIGQAIDIADIATADK